MKFPLEDKTLKELAVFVPDDSDNDEYRAVFIPDDSTRNEYRTVHKLTRHHRRKIVQKLFGDQDYRCDDLNHLYDIKDCLKSWSSDLRYFYEMTVECRQKNKKHVNSLLSSYFGQNYISQDIMEHLHINDFYPEESEIYESEKERLRFSYHILLRCIAADLSYIIISRIFHSRGLYKIKRMYEDDRLRLSEFIQYSVCKDLQEMSIFDHEKEICEKIGPTIQRLEFESNLWE